ncbi:MAG: flagellar hook-associated protein FlgL [Halomonas sp.]|uniref:flagellar hook-associated protein FlgL n=1 Tax=Halomonas sp. TaxID=1486246 RepID=UPI0039709077
MRISTVTMFEQGVNSLNRQQGDFLKVGQQIATGRRVVNPSDDPQAASRALSVSQAKAVTEQYTDSRISARNSLSQVESVLNSVSDAIASAKTLLIQGANDTLSDADRESVAAELNGIYQTLIGQANATDGNGRYLFGGYQDDAPPFQEINAGVITYEGDTNVRQQRVDATRLMEVSENGDSIFSFKDKNGVEAGLFATFESALDALGNPGDPGFRQTINDSMSKMDSALDNVLTRRASVGARLNELDVVDSVAGNRMLNYEQTLSDLVDLDYAEAISEYSLRQVGLQAAQKAFVDIKSLSLFDYLR